MNLLQQLKGIASDSLDSVDLENAVLYASITDAYVEKFNKLGIDTPEWLSEVHGALGREIEAKQRDYLSARLKAAELRRQGLKSREDRLRDTDDEIARLRAKLGK